MLSWGYCGFFYQYQEKRGVCEVCGFGPNLWIAAVKGLGFMCTLFDSMMLVISVFFRLPVSPPSFRNGGLTVSVIMICLLFSPTWPYRWRFAIILTGKCGLLRMCSS